MFERFSTAARVVVRDAVHLAEQERAAAIRPPHLLLSLIDGDGPGAKILAGHGVTKAKVVDALEQAYRRGGLSTADVAALGEVGIDVDAVVAALEQAHGEGVLAPAKRRRTFGPRWRAPFTTESKKVLEQSLREAIARHDNTIGDQHILLALLSRGDVTADILTSLGVTPQGVSAYLAQAG